jgi:phosphoglucosamine mutase
MIEEGKPLSALAACMERFPQVLVNVKVSEKKPLESLPMVQDLIARLTRELGDDGRILVRYSGTEAKVRVMVEGPNETLITGYANEIASALAAACA